jgi:chemotaxis response regulator CheB
VSPIRIHLGSMPEMLRAIITDLLHQDPDIVVVGRSRQGDDELECAREEWADVLITQDRRHDGNVLLDTLLKAPPICIFAISDDGRTADAVNLVRRPIALNDTLPSAFANAVRQIAGNLKEPRAGWDRQGTA